MSAQDAATEIIDEFSFFDDWADRYQHLIDQGRRLGPIRDDWRSETHKLKGCQSTVYFGASLDEGGLVQFSAESDAAIVQGLIALLLRVYSGRTPQDILATDASFLAGTSTTISSHTHFLTSLCLDCEFDLVKISEFLTRWSRQGLHG